MSTLIKVMESELSELQNQLDQQLAETPGTFCKGRDYKKTRAKLRKKLSKSKKQLEYLTKLAARAGSAESWMKKAAEMIQKNGATKFVNYPGGIGLDRNKSYPEICNALATAAVKGLADPEMQELAEKSMSNPAYGDNWLRILSFAGL